MAFLSVFLIVAIPAGIYYLLVKYPFYTKMTIFFSGCALICTLALPFLFFRPRDYRNAMIPAAFARAVARMLNITMEIRGLENVRTDRGGIVLLNHQSSLDLLVTAYLWPVIGCATVVSKIEVFYIPIFGLASYLWGTLYINRKNSAGSVKALNKESKAINERNAKLLIFPEGSRSQSEKLLPFKKGAFHIALDSKCPVQPVVVSKYYFLDSKTKRFDKGHAIIHILPEISTETYSKDTMNALMDDCRNVMQDEYTRLSREVIELQKCGKFE
ncbi:1-acyl-sn-glycerol-3-phosphate acyltransferase alpha [Hermetia illucens]|nr:1-acyl-sn-glycerol-3-phosphate acyltransferase alpha [Hermetia illucens]XP_037912783.1 1-acyl-sn-glycerol-3-phosphate acyltransferase alpha [Hermetia illucens]XP_037912784.1 1-acyl-sn-glycerol-3-phosphate acyltransferase alpha [Hermetia illucens]